VYETDVSDEELAVIRAIEAEPAPTDEAGRRFRRLFNEIERLRGDLARAEQQPSSSEAARIKTGYRGGWGGGGEAESPS
jgi:hypothetical protein